MDARDIDSYTDHRAIGLVTDAQDLLMDISNFPSRVNILKPQIDKILSEVQKNLPTIDFDSSDISSDSDEPIFFHQNLKLNELSSVFDDDKDLDTSLSQGDDPMLHVNSSGNLPSQNNEKTKNISAKSTDENVDNYEKEYDNDLVAILSKVTSPTEDELRTVHLLAQKMEDCEAELELREEADLKRSQNLGHFSKISSNSDATIPSRTEHASKTPNDRESKEHIEVTFATEETVVDNKNVNVVDACNINLEFDTDVGSTSSKESLPVTVQNFNQRLNDGVKFLDSTENRRITKNTKSRDHQIMSKFTLQEPTTLSLRFLEELDLDSLMNARNEEGDSWCRLLSMGQHSSNQMKKSHNGGGDKKTETEDLTLIQKLAQLSAMQSGTDTKSINSVDPQTGAARTNGGKLSASSHDTDMACQTPAAGTSCAGTNTKSDISMAKILYGRLKQEKRESEPQTVYIDLRGFEKQKEEERHGLINVQRVLRIEAKQGQEESSTDDDEMVERCDWRLTRQKIKKNLSAHGASSSFCHAQRETFPDKTANEPKYKKPPRVIALQNPGADRKWPIPSSDKKITFGVNVSTSTEEEKDNKIGMEELEKEKDKDQQKKEIMQQREERKKVQEQRIRMSEQIANGRSVATTQGRQPAGENTPVVFDTVSSTKYGGISDTGHNET